MYFGGNDEARRSDDAFFPMVATNGSLWLCLCGRRSASWQATGEALGAPAEKRFGVGSGVAGHHYRRNALFWLLVRIVGVAVSAPSDEAFAQRKRFLDNSDSKRVLSLAG